VTIGLREVVGEEVDDRLLGGCNVHWARSNLCVADQVNRGTENLQLRQFVLLQSW
jgi:hypothetical protein